MSKKKISVLGIFLFILPMSSNCFSGKIYTVNNNVIGEGSYLPISKVSDCYYIKQSKLVRVLFFIPISSGYNPDIVYNDPSKIYKFREVLHWEDIALNIAGFLFSVLTTTEEWEECKSEFRMPSHQSISGIEEIYPIMNLFHIPKTGWKNRFFFKNDRIELESESKEQITNVVSDILKSERRFVILLLGHASSSGDFRYNLELSWKRAEFIKKELVKEGIDGNRIVLSASGNSWRLHGIQPEFKDSEDRRVDLILVQE